MTSPLKEAVLGRLQKCDLSEDSQLLVISALETDGMLDEALGGLHIEGLTKPEVPTAEPPKPGAFISSITVEGFRGVGPRQTLDLHPGPGLTLVVGRNGSGKSSFAEALEVLFTGDNKRWSGRAVVWKEGWSNLHHDTCAVEAEFILEGESGATKATRTWAPGAALTDSDVTIQRPGKKKEDLTALGWTDALDSYRPFLSYNELGSMLNEGPTKLYEAIAKILGLDDLVEAEKRIKDAMSQRKKAMDQAKAELAGLLDRLRDIDDERAARCIHALESKKWNLDVIEEAVTGVITGPDAADVVNLLRQVAAVEAPSKQEVEEVTGALRKASEALKALAGTEAGNAKHLADLLDEALAFHRNHGDSDCPVCGAGTLDNSWRIKTEMEVARLRDLAKEATGAEQGASHARTRARAILSAMPPIVAKVAGAGAGIDISDVSVSYKSWAEAAGTEDLGALADHIELHHGPLELAVKRLKFEADKEIARREDLWRPMALDLAAWAERAKAAQEGEAHLLALKEAADWLKATSNDIRNDRFAPIADRTQRIWEQLRQQSSVALHKITLAGSGTARKVELKVTVDGQEGAALGVMSQGELHALALSLFLPRATLSDSPFRFIVIDDPVQSMDPARVDGLARVLEEVAGDRQVVVFTHDDRLPWACRLLGIDAKVIEVYRRLNSVVELRAGHDPVKRYCNDAWAVAKSTEIDPKVASNIVGVFCRSAIEAACTEVVTRRRLSRGESYDELDELLAKAEKLAPLISLALFDDASRAGEVLGRLNKGIGGWAADTYKAVQEASHAGVAASRLESLVHDSEKLARRLIEFL